ncbi:hypothetical protein PoB_004331400 [Plakobranchus ocellatus]|uniref:Uncharacterized protein n=1 Tax=Plakobranchus ocellatus TaxID=259542 RepID=A0AAV4BDC9_9GAST|nr:hypothetical protein PoB_004331400 [Plakobranchus ocellatus]
MTNSLYAMPATAFTLSDIFYLNVQTFKSSGGNTLVGRQKPPHPGTPQFKRRVALSDWVSLKAWDVDGFGYRNFTMPPFFRGHMTQMTQWSENVDKIAKTGCKPRSLLVRSETPSKRKRAHQWAVNWDTEGVNKLHEVLRN